MSTIVIHPTADQERIVKAFLEALDISFEKDDNNELPQHVLEGIEKGQGDYKAGRFKTYEEFKKKYPAE